MINVHKYYILKSKNITGLSGNRRFAMEWLRSRVMLSLERIYYAFLLVGLSCFFSPIATKANGEVKHELSLGIPPPDLY